ncbi:hypothetical protein Tco_0702474 [Tanacetum coccineum]|uniref:Uncharacterized protein n=1 Tax=Tanacetum coccineum TaxID=301880 RepID=A0ABQ4XXZ9_9ASTR
MTSMKIPITRKGEYDIWSMRMRQYICHTDHNLWDVIVNGDLEEEPAPTGDQSGPSAPPAPKTAKQLAARRNQERVKSIFLLAIPDEYLLKFHNVADAKSLGCNQIELTLFLFTTNKPVLILENEDFHQMDEIKLGGIRSTMAGGYVDLKGTFARNVDLEGIRDEESLWYKHEQCTNKLNLHHRQLEAPKRSRSQLTVANDFEVNQSTMLDGQISSSSTIKFSSDREHIRSTPANDIVSFLWGLRSSPVLG